MWCWNRSGRRSAGKTPALSQVLEIDPANPHWWETSKLPSLPKLPILPLPRLPRLASGPLGNGCLQTVRHPLGELAQLKPSGDSPDVSWEAYTLPINQPGRPHVLEVDYPSDVPQTLGISLLEPNAAGRPGADRAGLGRGRGARNCRRPPRRTWLRHRLVFWPRTSAPLLVISQSPRPAAGPLRQDSRVGRLGAPARPALAPCPATARERAAGGVFRSPLVPRQFLGQPKRSTPGAGAAWTTGTPSTRAARGWSNTCNTSATTA